MLTNDPVYIKFLQNAKIENTVKVDGHLLHVLPSGFFTTKEIERLRKLEEWSIELGNGPSIANFLPDSIRPKNVPKM